jgi:hypothetical protein
MAWKIIEKKLGTDADPQVTILSDTEEEVEDIPTEGCGAGSMVIVATKDLPVIPLNASGEWATD